MTIERMTVTRRSVASVLGVVILAGLLPIISGQEVTSQRKFKGPPQIPTRLRPKMEAQGTRYVVQGKERVVLTGSLTRASGPARTVQVVRDINGRFRVDQQGKVVAFDGSVERIGGGSLNSAERREIESLTKDVPEEFFAAIANGSALRIIGHRMRGDDGTTPDYQGPWYDVYELAEPPDRKRVDAPERKFFYFDSSTSELVLVRYFDGPSEVRTVLSDWQFVSGERVPGKVERLVDGRTELTFQVSQIDFAPDMADSFFSGVN